MLSQLMTSLFASFYLILLVSLYFYFFLITPTMNYTFHHIWAYTNQNKSPISVRARNAISYMKVGVSLVVKVSLRWTQVPTHLILCAFKCFNLRELVWRWGIYKDT